LVKCYLIAFGRLQVQLLESLAGLSELLEILLRFKLVAGIFKKCHKPTLPTETEKMVCPNFYKKIVENQKSIKRLWWSGDVMSQ